MKCRYEHDGDCCDAGADRYMCKCKKPCEFIWPLSNADHIRAMSDEELATFLDCFGSCHYCSEYETSTFDEHGILNCDGDCEQHISDRLKQPYKEDT